MRELRIHHFFDIIRDYGSGQSLNKHPYGHSYHLIGNEIFENKISQIKLVIKNDDICGKCKKLILGKCTDSIQHRSDFKSKEKFNNFIDTRIMRCMGYEKGQILDVKDIIVNADKYLDKIFEIYNGNDINHTKIRKHNVSIGINKKRKELLLLK